MLELKMVLVELFAGQPRRHRCGEQTYGHGWGEEGEVEMNGSNMETYYHM